MKRPAKFGILLAAFAFALPVYSQQSEQQKPPIYEFQQDHDPEGIGKFYMGREIAHFMSHKAADWLDRPEREAEERPSILLRLLKIQPGMSLVDLGAGSGYLTFPMAKLVGPKGKVYAVEIQQEMLDIIAKKQKERGVKNIVRVLGEEKDPKLPSASADLILLVDVYHEFDYPYEMTVNMVNALKPNGRLIFVEYRKEDPNVLIKLVHKMTLEQVKKEMAQFPELKFDEVIEKLPQQHVIIFKKVAK